jgi:hypothetical protein
MGDLSSYSGSAFGGKFSVSHLEAYSFFASFLDQDSLQNSDFDLGLVSNNH